MGVAGKLESVVNPVGLRNTASSGYTLVEVLIAMVILGLVLPGLATMLVSSRKAITSNYRMDQAFSYGQLVMDSVSIIPEFRVSETTRTAVIAGTTYTATLDTTKPGDGSTRLKLVVGWTQAGKTHSVTLHEVLRQDGLFR